MGSPKVKVLALLVLFICAGYYLFTTKGTNLPVMAPPQTAGGQAVFTETGVKLTYNYDSSASFYAFNSGNFYYCTKDGIKYIDGSTGKPIWEDVFTMTSPVMVGENEYVIVAEPKGNVVYVYGPTERRMYTNQFSGAIMNFSINAKGYATVTTKIEQDYETQVFNAAGKPLSLFKHEDKNVYPICADVSNDGRIATVGLLDINNVYMTSHIISAYLDEKESGSYTDGIFGSVPKEKQLVAVLKFMKNNFLVAFSDMEIISIAMGEENTMNATSSVELNNKIDSMGFFGESGFVLAYGDAMTGKDGLPQGQVAFYDEKGVQVSTYDLAKKVTSISCGSQNAIIGANRAYYAFTNKGKLLWRYNATQDFKQLIFLENSDIVLFATNTEAIIMKRGK